MINLPYMVPVHRDKGTGWHSANIAGCPPSTIPYLIVASTTADDSYPNGFSGGDKQAGR